jgi:hypothetical protein
MSTHSMKDLVRAHYGSQAMSEGRLEELMRLASESNSTQRLQRRGPRAALAVAAVVLMLLSIGAALLLRALPGEDSPELALAREMVHHHLKVGPTDMPGQDFETLRAALERLPFALAEPEVLAAEGLRPVGARYCSLRGHVAARVHLLEADGRSATLCEVADSETFSDVGAMDVTVDATRVRIWKRDGLLYALARAVE